MATIKRQKVFFLDIDGVLTTAGKPEERQIVDEAIAMLAKARELGYTRFVFITARAAPWTNKNLVPLLQKYNLSGASEIHCENGLYEVRGEKIILTPEAERFAKYKELLAKEIEAEITKREISAINKTKGAGKLVQVRFEPTNPEAASALQKACEDVVEGLKKQGKLPRDIKALETKSGTNIFPYTVNKGATAVRIEQRLRGTGARPIRVVGKAIGDDPKEDKAMAFGRKINGLG